MKKIVFMCLFLLGTFASKAADFVIEGTYDGKNYFFSNPVYEGDFMCAYSLFVNGKEVTLEKGATTFKVDFAALGLVIGDKYTVRIVHHDNCKPLMLRYAEE